MGKESEVLQAAQAGNVSKLENLFTQRQPKVLAGLFKGPNINWRDDSGCTALHLAALNGHNNAVVFLLQNDGSANIPDNAGSFPLHLAAFNGHHEVAKTLITRGPSRAQVNEANMAGDTALHVAAQYGHRYVVQVLLENHAEPHLRNAKEETALDLAAQYGRLSSVQLFLVFDVKLLQDAVHKHSPLHLAVRNGHEEIVKVLLDGGMPINATCDMGTALHCAALYGKVAVAKLLLQRGIDIDIEDDSGEKVLDVLIKHQSQIAQDITALIYEHSGAGFSKETQPRSPVSTYSGHNFEVVETKERTHASYGVKYLKLSTRSTGKRFCTGKCKTCSEGKISICRGRNNGWLSPRRRDISECNALKCLSSKPSGYDFVPPPRPRPKNLDEDEEEKDDENERTYSIVHGPIIDDSNRMSNLEDNFDLASMTPLKDNDKDFFPSRTESNGSYCLVGEVAAKSTQPDSDGREFRRPSVRKNTNEGPYSTVAKPNTKKPVTGPSLFSAKPLTSKTKVTSPDNVQLENPLQDSIYQVPPNSNYASENKSGGAPYSTQKVRSQTLPVMPMTQENQDVYHNVNLTNAPSKSSLTTSQELYDNVNLTNVSSVSQPDVYDNVNLSNSPVTPQIPQSYDNVNITNRMSQEAKPHTPDLTQDSYYQSPPCTVLQDKPADLFSKKSDVSAAIPQYTTVKTKSMKQKRTTIIKRDISLETTKEINIDEPATNAKPEPQNSNDATMKQETVSVETKGVSELSLETPPDTTNTNVNGLDSVQNEEPVTKPRRMKQNRTSVRSVSSGYRMSTIQKEVPLDESYEWNKIDHFLTDLEQFAETPEKDTSPLVQTDVATWLQSLSLENYEPMFLANGFDDIEFLAIMEDSDLVELGILDAEHRKKLLQELAKLTPPPVIGDEKFPMPQSVGEWLTKLKLKEYEERFNYNGYGNIDRVRVVWELELVTVLDITTHGHRKRMLHSLGRRPPVIKSDVSWAQRFADADAGRQKHTITDNSMDVARKLLETAESLKVDRIKRQMSGPDNVDSSSSSSAAAAAVAAAPPTIPVREDLGEQQAIVSTKTEPTVRTQTWKTSVSNSVDEQTPQAEVEEVQSSPKSSRANTDANWKHCADTLLYESVAYKTQYLGSHPVQQVRGVSSTLDACKKMKTISRNVHKMPSITLSISVRGIDYIDTNSKMVISQYAINHISFCAQDPTDLQMFAYITRDEQTRKNYCHVFRAASIEKGTSQDVDVKNQNLADEIIMTIGQCFELAYEQHMTMLEMKKMKESLTGTTKQQTQRGKRVLHKTSTSKIRFWAAVDGDFNKLLSWINTRITSS